jgi:hypothetical protein
MDPRFTLLDAQGAPLAAESDLTTAVAVLDNTTNLIWSRDNVGGQRMTLDEANTACAALDLAGATDWRVPIVRELLTLVDYERCDPAIDIDAFPSAQSRAYWTITPAAWSPSSYAWYVYFDYGYAYLNHRLSKLCVRAVRSVSPSGQ